MIWVLMVTCRVILGTVLLIAGLAKLRPSTWESAGRKPQNPAVVVTPILPAGEILLGTLILAGLWPNVMASVSVLLFSAFTAYTIRRIRNGDQSPCSCFGQLSKSNTGVQTIVRNSVLLMFAAVLAAITLLTASGGVMAASGPITVEMLAAVAILASLGLVALYLIDLVDPRLVHVIWTPVVGSGRLAATPNGAEARR